jgi:hypothetical protein
MNHFKDGQFTAYIGIDWADTKHDVCLQAAGSRQREFTCLAHQVADIEQWALSLRQRFGGPIAIALELTKGPIVYALQKYDFLVLFPINPSTLAKYREAFTPSTCCCAIRIASSHWRRRVWSCERWPPWWNSAEAWSMTGSASLIDYAIRSSSITRKHWVHWRWQCPTFLRQTFVEWAAQTVNKSFWAGAYYRQQKAKGCSHQAAVRALAFKWIRILYRCWQARRKCLIE